VKLEDKKRIAEDLHEQFGKAAVVIVTDYKGLDVAKMSDLRRKLKEVQIDYRVVKNSLLIRASEETDVALIKEHFAGPSAVALSYDDPVAPAKVLTQFAKDNDQLEIKGGVLRGKAIDFDEIKALATLPPRDVLLSKLLSVFNGVPTAWARVLNAVPQQLLNVLQAVKQQKETAEGS
jgi:large subunit ribosomal protein L10